MAREPDDLIDLLRTILEFELELRTFISDELKREYGQKWVEKIGEVIPGGLRRVAMQIRSVREQFALHDRPLNETDLLGYLSFGQYIDLIKNDEVFTKCIRNKLGKRETAVEGLNIIAATRNEIAHGRRGLATELEAPCRFYVARFRRHLLYTPQEVAEIERAFGTPASAIPIARPPPEV